MDAHDSVRSKVQALFSEIVERRSETLRGEHVAQGVVDRIKDVYSAEYGPDVAATLAMHLCEWNENAAFIVALHLFPERFTDDEIRAGVGLFLSHAPNYILASRTIEDQDDAKQSPGESSIRR